MKNGRWVTIAESQFAHEKQGLEAVRQKSGLTAFLNYLEPGGSERERTIAARWLRERV